MPLIDHYAHINRLSHIHPIEKLTFSMLMLLFSLSAGDMKISFFVFVISSTVIILARIPFSFYVKLLLLPLTFILLSLFPMIVSFTLGKEPIKDVVWDFTLSHVYVYIDSLSVYSALHIFLSSISSISCLYLLILTTPFVEILYLLKKGKVSPLFIEIVAVTYRFIFTLIDTVAVIFHSQTSRLGYSSVRKGMHSLGYLTSSLFLKSFQKASKSHQAVESRGGYGVFIGGEQDYAFSPVSWGFISVVLSLLVFLFFY